MAPAATKKAPSLADRVEKELKKLHPEGISTAALRRKLEARSGHLSGALKTLEKRGAVRTEEGESNGHKALLRFWIHPDQRPKTEEPAAGEQDEAPAAA